MWQWQAACATKCCCYSRRHEGLHYETIPRPHRMPIIDRAQDDDCSGAGYQYLELAIWHFTHDEEEHQPRRDAHDNSEATAARRDALVGAAFIWYVSEPKPRTVPGQK